MNDTITHATEDISVIRQAVESEWAVPREDWPYADEANSWRRPEAWEQATFTGGLLKHLGDTLDEDVWELVHVQAFRMDDIDLMLAGWDVKDSLDLPTNGELDDEQHAKYVRELRKLSYQLMQVVDEYVARTKLGWTKLVNDDRGHFAYARNVGGVKISVDLPNGVCRKVEVGTEEVEIEELELPDAVREQYTIKKIVEQPVYEVDCS